MKIPKKTRRKVRFGNPAVGTTHVGWVNTVEGGENYSRSQMVAMVDVPPEEVPEGALNLARSHRPYIEHVRILITSPETSNHDESNTLINLENNINGDAASKKTSENQTDNIATLTPLESAASILALEEEEELHKQNRKSFLIIFSLLDSTYATDFVNDLHGKPYTTLEPDITCSVYIIETLDCVTPAPILSSSLSHKNSQQLPEANSESKDHLMSKNNDLKDNNQKEKSVPLETLNCAVCLEKMEFPSMSSITTNSIQQQQHGGDAIITTVCNHSFHVDCLLGWQDSPCPVCRYDGGLTNEESLLSKCHVCGTTENNYICLICGVVSCSATVPSSPLPSSTSYAASASSSYNTSTSRIDDNCDSCTGSEAQNCGVSPSTLSPDSHAVQHYNETLHAYALDTRTQHVWDFCGQGYVHRLLQNSHDGKLVETHDPTNTNSHVRSSHPRYLTDAQEDFMVHAKLEGFANQYYNLLKSQLESQRTFYEERLEYIEQEHISSKKKNNSNSSSTANLITALKQEKHQLEQRCLTLRQKYRHMSREVIDLKSMNESLETGKKQFRMKIIEAQRNRTDAKNMFTQCLPPLEEKVASLIMELELEPGDEQQKQKSRKIPSDCNSSDDSKKPSSRQK